MTLYLCSSTVERLRAFRNAWFQRFARRENIADAALWEAVMRANQGQVNADLAGGVIKQRVARPGAGRSGGHRTLIFFRVGVRAVFAFGFAKSTRANIGRGDMADLKMAAKITLAFTEGEIDKLVAAGTLVEVECNDEDTFTPDLPK